MFQGNMVEELLYTVDKFIIKIRETMSGFEDNMLHNEFKNVLDHESRETILQLIADNMYDRTQDGFTEAVNNLVQD